MGQLDFPRFALGERTKKSKSVCRKNATQMVDRDTPDINDTRRPTCTPEFEVLALPQQGRFFAACRM